MTVYCHITKAYLLFPISEMWYRSLQYKCAENGTTLHKGLCLVADIVLKTAQFYSQHSGHIHHYITMWCILSIISHQKPSTDTCNMLLINCISLKHEHAIYLWCVKAKSMWICVWWVCAYLVNNGHLSWHNVKNSFVHKSQAEIKLIEKDKKDTVIAAPSMLLNLLL